MMELLEPEVLNYQEISDKIIHSFVMDKRLPVSHMYLQGNGIEIGALHNPLPLPPGASARYVDRLSVEGLREHYPELRELDLVHVDIVDDAEALSKVENNSLDFIIANHMLEHLKNPIGTLQNFFLKLRPGGVIYLAIPDKRFTFDAGRPLTDFQHLVKDYYVLPDQYPHFREFAKFGGKLEDEQEIEILAKDLFERDYSIHYHVWDNHSFMSFLYRTNEFLGDIFEILNITANNSEVISILCKK